MNDTVAIEQVENGFIVRHNYMTLNVAHLGNNSPFQQVIKVFNTLKEVQDYLTKAFKGK